MVLQEGVDFIVNTLNSKCPFSLNASYIFSLSEVLNKK